MALDRDKMLAAMAAGELIPIYKASVVSQAAGYLTSLWRAAGSPLWRQGAIPGAASTPTDDTAGGIALPSFGTNQGRIYRFAPVGVFSGTFMLYDRLAHMGGLVANLATEQTVNLDAATAITAGRATEMEIEWYIQIYHEIGITASNLTVKYRDLNDAVDKTITITGFTGASPLNRSGRCVLLVPPDGIQIKRVVSVTHSISSGTAGNYGVTARRLLCSVGQMIANVKAPGCDAISLALPSIKDSSCLEMLVQCSTTATGIIQGDLKWGQVAE